MSRSPFLQRALSLILSCTMGLASGCIHTEKSSGHTMVVDLSKDKQGLTSRQFEDLTVGTMSYHPRVMPLETFFKKVMSGQFDDALRRLEVTYKPSNTDSEALKQVMKVGLMPVFLKIENSGRKPVDLSRLKIRAQIGDESVDVFPDKDLPQFFRETDLKAVGANIYNTTVVIGVVAIYTIAYIAATNGYNTFDFIRLDGQVYNDIHKTTPIAYSNYLFTPATLAPGAVQQGLVFFRFAKGQADGNDLQLTLSWR